MPLFMLIQHGADVFHFPRSTGAELTISTLPIVLLSEVWTSKCLHHVRHFRRGQTWLTFGGELTDAALTDFDPRVLSSNLRTLRAHDEEEVEQPVKQVDFGDKHAALITTKGAVFVWGADGPCGRLGLETNRLGPRATTTSGRWEAQPKIVLSMKGRTAHKVTISPLHTSRCSTK